MAQKPEIQYIRYYVDGTAARKPEPQLPRRSQKPLPRKKRRPRYVVKVQPLAVLGIVLAVVLLGVMISGIFDFLDAREALAQLQQDVQDQRSYNAQLREKYEQDIDLEEIRRAALALGMVPEDQVRHISISVSKTQPEQDDGFLTQLTAAIPGFIE